MIGVAVDLGIEKLPTRRATMGELEAERLASRCRVVIGEGANLLKDNMGGVTARIDEASGSLIIRLPLRPCGWRP